MGVPIAVAQFVSTPDGERNVETIEALVSEAGVRGAKLLALHEIATTTYFCVDDDPTHFDKAEAIPGSTTDRICEAAAKAGVSVLLPIYELSDGQRYNTACMIDSDKGIIGLYRKSHIPERNTFNAERGANESMFFAPGNTGFKVWETSAGLRIGCVICHDRHFPEGTRDLGLQNAHVILIPTAAFRKIMIETMWETELQAIAFQNNCYVVGINKVGPVTFPSDGRYFPGRSVIINVDGVVMARADDSEGLTLAEVDPIAVEKSRATHLFYRHRRPELYGRLIEPVSEPLADDPASESRILRH